MKKSKPKTVKMPAQEFKPAGEISYGAPKAEPTKRERAQHKLWQEWHRYGRIKLAAAVGGNVDSERDARVAALYAKRGDTHKTKEISAAVIELRKINESLAEFHKVIVDHKLVDDALAILIRTRPGNPRKFRKHKPTAAERRERERKIESHKAWVKEVEKMKQCQCAIHKRLDNS
jgi:hypothetical protein